MEGNIPKDKLGQDILPGMVAAVAMREGNVAVMRIYEVVRVNKVDDPPWDPWRILCNNEWGSQSTLRTPSRMITLWGETATKARERIP